MGDLVNPRPSARERTRHLLLETARDMIASGEVVAVQSLAEKAGVSRATAYRYFTSPDSIVLNVSLPVADNPFRDPQWVPPDAADDADLATRMGHVVAATAEWAFDHANELRSVLAASLAPDSHARGMSRVGKLNRGRWIDSVLDDLPPEIDAATRRRLTNALVPLFGADAVIWTTDAAELDRDQAVDQLRWTAETLVRAVLNPPKHLRPEGGQASS